MIALGFRKPPPDQVALSEETQDTMIMWLTTTSGILFTGSVIAFALLLFDVPFWPSTLVLLALVALLMGLLLWVRRTNKRRSRNIVRKED
jgi:membrane protein implicated in regulation of membrane protease activity